MVISLLIMVTASQVYAEPLLNGMAVHQELDNDRFIGAIYSERLTSSADVLLAADMPMRLEMKITANRGMAARRFTRMWIEGMAINMRSDALTAQADNMVAFTKMFQDRLLENDHIVIALTPGEGVTVSVNGIELGRIENDAFFGLLASTWVGRVPLSSNFRAQLLQSGDVNTALQARYNSITPSEARRQQVASWIAPPAPKPTPKPAAPKPEVPVIASKPDIKPPKLDLASSGEETSGETAGEAESQVSSLASESASDAASSSEESSSLAASSASTSESSSSSSSLAAAEAEEILDESDDDFVPAFTAESLLANQRYFSTLVRKVQSEIKYPRRALQRGYEGFIRIAITINRNGELLSADILEASDYALLNNEAMKAVENAAPFAPIPEVINGQRHEFTIPITFALSR